jgi:hypothetical protein
VTARPRVGVAAVTVLGGVPLPLAARDGADALVRLAGVLARARTVRPGTAGVAVASATNACATVSSSARVSAWTRILAVMSPRRCCARSIFCNRFISCAGESLLGITILHVTRRSSVLMLLELDSHARPRSR